MRPWELTTEESRRGHLGPIRGKSFQRTVVEEEVRNANIPEMLTLTIDCMLMVVDRRILCFLISRLEELLSFVTMRDDHVGILAELQKSWTRVSEQETNRRLKGITRVHWQSGSP
jgi:hypothetical protein